jgi:DNA-binding protein H-NS
LATLKELLAQREELEAQIEQAKNKDRTDAVAQIRALMDDYGLTVADLGGRASAKKSAPAGGRKPLGKVAPKYRNASTGETWSGRGLQPNWLKAALAGGKSLEDFAL